MDDPATLGSHHAAKRQFGGVRDRWDLVGSQTAILADGILRERGVLLLLWCIGRYASYYDQHHDEARDSHRGESWADPPGQP
jgi:hypothetical protein